MSDMWKGPDMPAQRVRPLPVNLQSVCILRQAGGDNGWSVFYTDERGDFLELYAGFTIRAAALVSTQFWKRREITRAWERTTLPFLKLPKGERNSPPHA